MKVSICHLRDLGIINDKFYFLDDLSGMNMFSTSEKAVILNNVTDIVNNGSISNYLNTYTSRTIYPISQTVIILRLYKDKLIELKSQ